MFANIPLADELANRMRHSYQTEESKLTLGNTLKQAYQYALLIFYEVAQTFKDATLPQQITLALQGKTPNETIWHFIEKSKTTVLLAKLTDAEAKVLGKIPAQLLQTEEDIKIQLNNLNQTIANQEAKPQQQQNTEFLPSVKKTL